MVTRFAQPAFDVHQVDLSRSDRLAKVKAVSDEETDCLTLGTDGGTGKRELRKMFDVRLDRTMEFGYNDHA